jgi:hypothetical protein
VLKIPPHGFKENGAVRVDFDQVLGATRAENSDEWFAERRRDSFLRLPGNRVRCDFFPGILRGNIIVHQFRFHYNPVANYCKGIDFTSRRIHPFGAFRLGL